MNKLAHVISYIRPGGGPFGYLYNLDNVENIEKLYDVVTKKKIDERIYNKNKKSISWITKKVVNLSIMRFIQVIFNAFKYYNSRAIKQYITLEDYEYLVFHDIRECSSYLKKAKPSSNQRIYLMIHSPVNPAKEKVSIITNNTLKFIAEKIINRLDCWVFRRVSGMIAPSKTALDNHYIDDIKVRDSYLNLPIVEIVSGVVQLKPSRKISFGSGLVAGYFGRFISDKGFDLYCDLAEKCAANNTKVNFICAGAGELEHFCNEHITNLGWRTDVADLISAVDVVIVPNRVAYFDLIILEAMSLGKTVITTDLGGSTILKRNAVKLIAFGNFIDEAMEILNSGNIFSPGTVIKIYDDNYSVKRMAERYNNVIKSGL
jgi:glycosyltransferase involved in cell wall biosynthesis